MILFISVSVIPSTGTTDVKQITIPASSGNILYVGGSGPNNYTKIQDAVDNASDGDTVFVYHGIYEENIIINKSIDLIGENKETTIIDGMNNDNAVIFDKCTSNIRSFSIRNGNDIRKLARGILICHYSNLSMIEDCIVFNCTFGIEIEDSKDVRILNCNISDNIEGIMLVGARYCWISGCVLSNRQRSVSINLDSENNNVINCSITGLQGGILSRGIDIYENNNNVIGCNLSTNGDGIYIGLNGDNNRIENCNISNNKGRGIVITTSNNSIKNTIVSNNGLSGDWELRGIEIFEGSNNVIEFCQISNNRKGGIYISWEAWSNYILKSTIENNGHSSSYFGEGILCHQGNYIYLNNFIDNREQAYDVESKSHWDNGELGNYWNDYTGMDNDYDGIGDTPYNLYDESNQDNYPLMLPYKAGPNVGIKTPDEGFLYLRNLKILPWRTTLIIGNIKIKADAANYNDGIGIEKVEFYVDGRLRHIDKRAPYTWRWRLSSHIKHKHTITVVAYDKNGNSASDEIDVWKFF